GLERDVPALRDLEAELDVVVLDRLAALLRHLLVADPRARLPFQLVEVDVVVPHRGVRLHRHGDEPEADGSGPDGSRHDRCYPSYPCGNRVPGALTRRARRSARRLRTGW